MTEDARREVLKRALLGNRPFEALCEGLNLGESLADAWRKGCVLLGIEWDNSKLDLLVKWGLDLGVLIGPPSSPALAIEFQRQPDSSVSPIPAAAFEAEARARLFNSEAIGRSANNALDENDRGLLAAAVLALPTDPPTTVEKAGQAVENFLREISKTRGFDDDAKKCNGAGQLASMLVGKGVLHSHHVKLVDAVGTLRNAKAHDKDKKSLVPWQITRTGASASLLMAHASIKGIHEYITSGGQTI